MSVLEESNEAPNKLLKEVNALYATLHAGQPQAPLPQSSQGQEPLFLLTHVCNLCETMLEHLGAPSQNDTKMPVMQRIRANTNELCVQLVGQPLCADVDRVTLAQLTSHMRELNQSFQETGTTCAVV